MARRHSSRSLLFLFFFIMSPRPPISTLFPYTTLFRSAGRHDRLRERSPGVRLQDREPERQRLVDRKSTRLNSSHVSISYAVFCLKKKKIIYSIVSCIKKKNQIK